MKIYFTASLRGKKEFGHNYTEIVKVLNSQGNKTYADHILRDNPISAGDLSKEDAKKNYSRILTEIKKADIMVAEVSYQSLSVGHELTEAMALNKPLIVLYTGDRRPGLLFGSSYDKMVIVQYESGKVEPALNEAIEKTKSMTDVRFNFFVSPKILNYLDWVAQNRKVPRSVFLRDLIEKEMKKDKDFKGEN